MFKSETTFELEVNSLWLNNLYDLYAPGLLGVITRIVGSAALSEKILYTTFIEIWDNRHNYNPLKEKIFIWMNNIARRLAIEALNTKDNIQQPEEENIESLVFSNEIKNYLSGKREVSEIDETEIKALRLMFINGFTIKEVANQLNMPIEILIFKVRMAIIKITGKK